jgi:uncharacterized protein YlaI
MARTAAQRRAWSKLPRHVKRFIRTQPISVWAKRIKREFSYKCAMCETEDSLEAHHIYFKSLFPSRIDDLDNGISLCTKCHDRVHSLYIESPQAHFDLINILNKKREQMKSIDIKGRNPSGQSYQDGFQILELEIHEPVPEESRRVLGKKEVPKTLLKKSPKPAKLEKKKERVEEIQAPKKRGRPKKSDAAK